MTASAFALLMTQLDGVGAHGRAPLQLPSLKVRVVATLYGGRVVWQA